MQRLNLLSLKVLPVQRVMSMNTRLILNPLFVYFVSYQQIKGDEDGARGESNLCPG